MREYSGKDGNAHVRPRADKHMVLDANASRTVLKRGIGTLGATLRQFVEFSSVHSCVQNDTLAAPLLNRAIFPGLRSELLDLMAIQTLPVDGELNPTVIRDMMSDLYQVRLICSYDDPS